MASTIAGKIVLLSARNHARFLPILAAVTATVALAVGPVSAAENGTIDTDSSNWSGYAALTSSSGQTFTAVSGDFVIPTITKTPSITDTYSAFWVGLDGYSSDSVEQIGIEADYLGNDPTYFAWYEMYPADPVTINSVPVAPGQSISVSVNYLGNNDFDLTLDDLTTGDNFSIDQTLSNPALSSAEWIAEAPSDRHPLPLANFGSVTFTDASATLSGTGGATGPISTFSNALINLIPGHGGVGDITGPLLDSGSSFVINTPEPTTFGFLGLGSLAVLAKHRKV